MSEKHIAPANLATDDPQPPDRQAILDAFDEQPDNDGPWATAYSWVRAEGNTGTNGIAGDIPAEELITMAETVRQTDPAKRYDLMTTSASNGKLWFDVIKGFSMDSIRQVLQSAVKASAQHNQAPFYKTLDLATGTGNSLAVLQESSEHVVGVDRNQALLQIAKKRAGNHTSLVQADITKLPFEDESFDLISSLGLEGSLDKEAQTKFYKEVARVMRPGANYIAGFYNYPHTPSEDMAQTTQTSKAMLADMICDTVSGGASIVERLDDEETDLLMAELGLQKEYYLDTSDQKNHVILQVITKL